MCITVIWGIYMIFFQSESREKTVVAKHTVDKLGQFVSDVVKKMKDSEPSIRDTYVIEKADQKWMKDPFLVSIGLLRSSLPKKQVPTKMNTTPANNAVFSYTGYLELGNTRLAIINGMEYEAGDSLDIPNHYVKEIYSNRIIIGQLNSAAIITVMIEETITTSN